MASKNVQTYKIELDTSGLISSYRNAIKQMQQAGVSSNITVGLENSLTKIEGQFKELENAGNFGVKGSKGIESFEKKAEKLYGALDGLGREMNKVANNTKNIDDSGLKALKKELNAVTKTIKTDFGNIKSKLKSLGIGEEITEQLGDTIKTEKELTQALQDELNKRVKAEKDAADKISKYKSNKRSAYVDNNEFSFDKVYALSTINKHRASNNQSKITQQDYDAMKQKINNSVNQGLKNGLNSNEIKNNIKEILNKYGLEVEQYFKNGANYTGQIKEASAAVKQAIEQETEELSELNKEYKQAQQNRNLLGSEDGVLKTQATTAAGAFEDQNSANEEGLKKREELLQKIDKETENLNQQEETLKKSTEGLDKAVEENNNSFEKQVGTLKEEAAISEQAADAMNGFKNTMLSALSIGTLFNQLRNIFQKTYEDVKRLDKSFAQIAMVTSKSVSDMWASYDDYASMAQQLGQTTDSIIEASALFYQQGLEETEALELTANTMKLATLAGVNYSEATEYMTSAIRGFKMEMDEGAHITDVYSTLAANAAAKVEDIAAAMSRTASIANSAGMSFENTSAFLTQMIETTQESAENIGTSLKTIIARFTELKTSVAGTSESEFQDLDFNKVDTALKSVGVQLKDTTGQFRNLDEVFLELSQKWNTLDRNTQRYVATIAAGSRQQSRFIAMMDNYERTAELIEIAADSEGKADEQFAKYADTMEYKLNQLSTKWEQFRVKFLDSELFKEILDIANKIADRLATIKLDNMFDAGKLIASIAVIGKSITNMIQNIFKTSKDFSELGKAIEKPIKDKIDKITKKVLGIKIELKTEKYNKQLEELEEKRKALEQKLSNIPIQENKLNALNNAARSADQFKKIVKDKNDANGYLKDLEKLNELYPELNGKIEAVKKRLEDTNKARGTEFNKLMNDVKKLDNAIEELKSDIDDTSPEEITREINEINQETDILKDNIKQQEESQEKLNASISKVAKTSVDLLGPALNSLAVSISGVVSGTMSLSEANDVFVKSLGVQIANLGLQTIAMTATKYITDATAFSFKGLMAAEWGALWPILAIGAAIAALYIGVKVLSKLFNKTNELENAQESYNNALEKTNQLQEAASSAKTNAKNLKDEAKEVEDLKEEYDKLSLAEATRGLTEEESERFKEVKDEIADLYPEVISYYNQETGQLELQKQLWEEKIELAKQLAKEGEVAQNLSQVSSVKAKMDTEAANFNLKKETLEEQSRSFYENGESPYTKKQIENIIAGSYDKNNAIESAIYNQAIEKGYSANLIYYTLKNQYTLEDGANYDKAMDLRGELSKAYQEQQENLNTIEASKYNQNLAEFNLAYKNEMAKVINAEVGGESQHLSNIAAGFAKVDRTGETDEQGLEKVKNAFNEQQHLWSNMDEDLRTVAEAAGYSEQTWNDITWKNEKGEYTEDAEEAFALLKENYERYEDSLVGAVWIEELEEDAKNSIEEYYNNIGDMTEDEIDSAFNDVTSDRIDGDALTSAKEYKDQLVQSILEDAKITAESLSGIDSSSFSGWTGNELGSLNKALTAATEKYGEYATQQFSQDIFKLDGLTNNQKVKALNFDWDSVNITNKADKLKEFQTLFSEMGDEGAEELFNSIQKRGKKDGVINLTLKADGIEELFNSIDEMTDKIESLGDSIANITKELAENGEMSFSTFNSFQKQMEELGLNAYDYVSIDNDGKITADADALERIYDDQLKAQIEKVDLAIEQHRIDIKKIENEIAYLKLLNIEDDTQTNITKNRLKAMDLDPSTTTASDIQEVIKTKEAELDIMNEQLDTMLENRENQVNYFTAMHRAHVQSSQDLEDVTKAQEDYNSALEAYNDQLEQVAEKQEALNEKIQEYNDLLYGSKNRESSLDQLYNYDEAINSFNDQITRAKDLLSNSKDVNDAVDALKSYSAATHNVIAEELAKQQVLKAGLNNYGNTLENGTYSYTNSETGEVTNIDFGKYVKKNDKTGKYVIDQRLINEARFTDKMKDWLEKQVSNYNKYSDDLLKSEDNVAKAEKELQDLRKDALSKYVTYEQQIADALKAAYEEEVNGLKEKYDSMKSADDDYINALKESIEKQKKLREQESKYEDLAKKEKKLSLMQRDTSGVNDLEIAKLEEDIQKDRESMLDEAINDVIEGLSELYTSQQETRDAEIELKEALVDNTAFWNQKAEEMATQFDNAEEYAQYLSSLSEEYSMMTLAQQQQKLQEYGETYTSASEYMALQAMDSASETGDFIVDTVDVTGQEVSTIVQETAQTFIDEVSRSFNETTAAIEEDMKKAQEAITDAKKALAEASEKLDECAQKVNETAAALQNALNVSGGDGEHPLDLGEVSNGNEFIRTGNVWDDLYENLKNTGNFKRPTEIIREDGTSTMAFIQPYIDYLDLLYNSKDKDGMWFMAQAMGIIDNEHENSNNIGMDSLYNRIANRMINENKSLQDKFSNHKYAQGGLVNYTGPAWVDGSPSQPEAFLSSEDTLRIGNAAKILSNLPVLADYDKTESIVNNSVGDTSIEINMNIEHMDSEMDLENVLKRVKDEVIAAARPTGTNVILNQY